MFHRIFYQDWVAIVPIISFVFTAGVFLIVSIRALSLPKKQRDNLANIPFEDGAPDQADTRNRSSRTH
ncbi:hypothetical protein ACFSSA_03075 [Luteolibacter algae]|uniref:Cbb3-type cytochrome c oxidase subunit 3 n=1 Tax=Luteolibacter algae TaxID=454151 RepID=A0ABW5D6L2_9BACT